ncbi:DUF3993 domain-containing protein [Actinomycetes bacterium NPDC127524]
MSKYFLLFTVALIAMAFSFSSAGAKGEVHNNNTFGIVQEAFNKQVSISEKPRTKKEIHDILQGYFTEDVIKKFMKQNVVKVKGGYAALGSDNAAYYIPFFSYGTKTKVIENQNHSIKYVQEKMQAGEGPVSYTPHYETVKMEEISGKWKVSSITINSRKLPAAAK